MSRRKQEHASPCQFPSFLATVRPRGCSVVLRRRVSRIQHALSASLQDWFATFLSDTFPAVDQAFLCLSALNSLSIPGLCFRPHAWLFSPTCYISPNPFFTNKHYRVTSSTLMTTPLRKTSRRQRRQKDDFWGLHHPRRPHVQASSNPHGPSIRYHEYQP